MTDLEKLIANLQIGKLIIIEDDFQQVEDASLLFNKLFTLYKEDFDKAIDYLQLNGFDIKDLAGGFFSIDNKENYELHVKKDNPRIKEYIEYSNNPKLVELFNIKRLEFESFVDKNPKIKEHFLKLGLFAEIPEHYLKLIGFKDSIFKRDIPLRIYKDLNSDEFDNYKSHFTNHGFVLTIIDKRLGNGDNKGVELANSLQKFEETLLKNLILLYTSSPVDKTPKEYSDYFLREVGKAEIELEKKIFEVLIHCAYALLFKKIETLKIQASKKSTTLALQNSDNINYLLDKFQNEGIAPYEAINIWYNNALNYFTDKELTEGEDSLLYRTIYNNISFLKDNYFQEQVPERTINKDIIQKLETSEVFDYSINKKFLPPAPGDIFKFENSYFVLVGQECDILLRRDKNERKAKKAELLFAKDEDRLDKKKNNDNQTISFDNFENKEKEIRSLKINFTYGKMQLIDFQILDLCMFNDDGKCKINTATILSEDIASLLPEGKDLYFKELQTKFNSLIKIKETFEKNDIDNYLKQELDYTFDDNNIIYSIQRVCRLKGNFKYLLNHYYWSYRGRIDLNEIGFRKKIPFLVKLIIKYEGTDIQYGSFEIEKHVDENKFYIELSELQEKYQKLSNIGNITINSEDFMHEDTFVKFNIKKNILKIDIPNFVYGNIAFYTKSIKIEELKLDIISKKLIFNGQDNGINSKLSKEILTTGVELPDDLKRLKCIGDEIFIEEIKESNEEGLKQKDE